jgi:uncharacterized membrane protein YecN with MAPEG domain
LLINLLDLSHFGVDYFTFVGLFVIEDVVFGNWGINGLHRQIKALDNVVDFISRNFYQLVVLMMEGLS